MELNELLSNTYSVFEHLITDKKLTQLVLLKRVSALLYLASDIYVLSGILGAIFETNTFYDAPSILLYSGTILVFVAFILLITYTLRSGKNLKITI